METDPKLCSMMKELTDKVMTSSSGKAIVKKMSEITVSERKYLARSRRGSRGKQTLFFRVCIYQPIDTVEYFLRCCEPDINERCTYKTIDKTETITEVSPLWVAASLGNIELANLLLSNGANVNGCSDTKSTPLRIACKEGHIGMVWTLMSKGADLSIANDEGTTCLMSATGTVNLVEYLLEKGAEVNARETGNWMATALHYAVYSEANDVKLVKLLVEAGANMNAVDKNGNAPFVCAALGSRLDMMTYLLEANNKSTENVIKAYEVLGLSLLIDGEEIGIQYLIKANKHKSRLGIYELVSNPVIDKFRQYISLVSFSEDEVALQAMSHEKETLQSLAILVCSRHLRADSDYSLYMLMEFASTLRERDNFEQSFLIYHMLYNLILEQDNWYHENVGHCLVRCVTLIYRILSQCLYQSTEQYLCKVEPLLIQCAVHIKKAYEFQFPPRNKEMRATFRVLLFSFLHLVDIYLRFVKHHMNNLTEVNAMVALNPRTDSEETLLHLLVDYEAFCEGNPMKSEPFDPYMDFEVISWLLHHDMDINCLDSHGETPLSTLMYNNLDNREEVENPEEIVTLLLEQGAHLDLRSKNGTNPLDYCYRYNVEKIKYLSLQCLAADTVIEYKLSYQDSLPNHLVSFVKLHGHAGDEFI